MFFAALATVVACANEPPPKSASDDASLYYARPAPSASVSPQDLEAQTLAAQIRIARATGLALRVAAAVKIATDGACPTASSLVDGHAVNEKITATDPWGTPYAITCQDDDVRVRSAGPDQRLDTADDITVP